ncbi:MAG: DNA polymerase/3'-5' exonuclease PolX [Acidobacteria bacterium]|nr:MAG: DNA polymerase/3'-5' exonuclease PolX [Acidobacteriota bacterium]
MASTNQELARIFSEMAAALELTGANPFRAVSNNRVARELRDLTEDVGALVAEDPETAVARLTALPGIGKGSAQKIVEYVQTGGIDEHRKLMAKVPRGLFEVLEIPGIGPKAAKAMWEQLGIESVADLKARLDDPALAALPRMGKKTVENIRRAILFSEKTAARVPLGKALPLAIALRDELAALPGVRRLEYAGSLRRGCETIGDLDFVAACDDPEGVRRRFTEHPSVTQVLAHGDTKCSVRLESEGVAIQADLRLVPEAVYGAALLYFTGSKEHNVRLRERAIKRGLRLNEYGLFRGSEERPQEQGKKPLAAATEEEIYAALDLPWIPPELREDRGELDRPPPRLIEVGDVKAELHAHTTASDGRMSIAELAACARERGFHTVAVTDHSPSQVIANGLSPERLLDHLAAVRAANDEVRDVTILAGSEVDVLPDGRLDYDDELLRRLDLVVASPHAALRQSPAEATARLLKAIAHPRVHVIGHPTGRIVGRREGLAPDMAALFAAAAEHDVALEVNANWLRLDLRDVHVRGALDHGCKIAIDTDAHRPEHFDLLIYGVLTARRGGLEAASCINAWPAEKLHAWLAAKRDA